jgi:hypothetical protein
MRYVSPFQELGIEADGNLDKSDLNLAKKRLLAELDLSSKSTIMRGSVEMTKDDIIKQFDKLSAIQNWDFHRLVLADKSLLGFVQDRQWHAKNYLKTEAKYDDVDFIEFISPYFAFSYKTLVIKYLTAADVYNLRTIFNISPPLLTEADRDDVWYSVESFLEVWKIDLDDISENVEQGEDYTDKTLLAYHGKSFIDCLNLLPEDFRYFRDDYALSLYNLSANSWNKNKHYRAAQLVKNARNLDISEDTAAMIDERIAWFDAELKRINSSDDSDSSWDIATTVRVLLFIIFVLARIGACH